jgi:penicillin-binding protein 2
VAVGQGYNAFTLLQLAQGTSTLANDGLYRQPHLVRALRDPRNEKIQATEAALDYKIPLKKANVDIIKTALGEAVRAGTARRAFAGATYQAAGKTGTAQVYSLRGAQYRASAIDERLRDHALFMGFAPLENPSIAVALIVENAGWGARVAAPIARKVFDYWLDKDRKDAFPLPQSKKTLATAGVASAARMHQ